jgi:NTE family protein
VINLALQGGGAHGAFTWGVLDRLLEDGRVEFEGVSGTSAGAMNAVMLAHGLTCGGPELARQTLAQFWERVSEHALPDPAAGNLLHLLNGGTPDAPTWLTLGLELTRYFSPSQLNPLEINPLRAIVGELVDFERLRRRDCPLKLFIAATQVRSGRLKVFTNEELSVETLLASACLPSLHPPVEIDGEIFWDGGFSGNPAVLPLVFDCRGEDILLVLLLPRENSETPTTVQAIADRGLEFKFSTGFLQEMRTIAHTQRRVEQAFLTLGPMERRFQRLRFHLIEEEEWLPQLSRASKFNVQWPFLTALRDHGRECAGQWLEQHYDAIGRRSTVDIFSRFG